jgi:hypothetical protein
VSRAATAFGFPAVTHVRGSARHDEIVPMAKKHVAAREHATAVFYCREVQVAANLPQPIPWWSNFPVNTQARDAAVGINLETQMRPTLVATDRKRIFRVAV